MTDRLESLEAAVSGVDMAVGSAEIALARTDIYGIDDVVAALRAIEEAVRNNGAI